MVKGILIFLVLPCIFVGVYNLVLHTMNKWKSRLSDEESYKDSILDAEEAEEKAKKSVAQRKKEISNGIEEFESFRKKSKKFFNK